MSLLDLWNNFFSEIHQFSIVVNGTFRWLMVENLWNTDATYSWVLLQLPLIINDSLPPLSLEKEAWALSFISSTLAFLPVCNTIGPQNRQSVKAFCLAIYGVRVDTAKVCRKHHYKMNARILTVNLCSCSCRWRDEIFHFLLFLYLSFLEYDIKAKTHWFVLFYFVTHDIACISRNHAT